MKHVFYACVSLELDLNYVILSLKGFDSPWFGSESVKSPVYSPSLFIAIVMNEWNLTRYSFPAAVSCLNYFSMIYWKIQSGQVILKSGQKLRLMRSLRKKTRQKVKKNFLEIAILGSKLDPIVISLFTHVSKSGRPPESSVRTDKWLLRYVNR